ncbi:MAG: heparinase II/III-family protein, partial [Desulfobacterales bacterium]|nr:heparinase II/III-family protein [Desulfobacterales bacterium]
FSYHDKSWRDHFRSTMAHNTVTIDNQDQCVFWGPFRVAYPPKVRLLEWSDNHVAGEHEGYCRLSKPVIHRRRIERRTTSEWEILDQFEGRGEHEFALTFQFAPGAQAEVSGVNGEVRWPDRTSLQVICVTPPAGTSASVEQGWVSPGWNLKKEAPRYVLRWRSKVPVENRIILKIKTA